MSSTNDSVNIDLNKNKDLKSKKSKKKLEKKSESTIKKKNTDVNHNNLNENNEVEENTTSPIKILLDAVSIAQRRGAYNMSEISVIIEAYNYISHQYNNLHEN